MVRYSLGDVLPKGYLYLQCLSCLIEDETLNREAVSSAAKHTRMVLKQKFQSVSGNVELTGQGDLPVKEGGLRGDELRLMLADAVEMVGRATGDTLAGTLRRSGRELASWTARRVP